MSSSTVNFVPTVKDGCLPRWAGRVERACSESLTRLFERSGLPLPLQVSVFYVGNYQDRGPEFAVQPSSRGSIVIVWRGSFGKMVRLSVLAPEGRSPEAAFTALMNARSENQQGQKGEDIVPSTPIVLAKILGRTETPVAPVSITTHAATPAPSPVTDDKSPVGALLGNADQMDLFLTAVLAVANDDGMFTTTQAIQILQADFGFPQVSQSEDARRGSWPLNFLKDAALKGFIHRERKGTYKVPPETMARLNGVTHSEAVLPGVPAATSEALVQIDLVKSVGDIAVAYAEIQMKIALAQPLRDERERLLGQLARINEELTDVDAVLSDPATAATISMYEGLAKVFLPPK